MSKVVVLRSGTSAQLNPECSGFAHGFGIFETIRIADGRLEFWRAHYERFLQSASVFGLHLNQSEESLLQAIRELIQSEKRRDGIVKLSLLKDGTGAGCYVYTRPMITTEGAVNIGLSKQSPLNEHSLLAGHKTHNYMESALLKQSAVKTGFFDVVRLNTAKHIAETAMANLFLVKDNILYTPNLLTGILPGIIRAEVLEIAEQNSIRFEEGHYLVDFLKAADAAFLTNSSFGILSVCSFEAGDFSVTFDTSSTVVEILETALSDAKKSKSIALTDE